MLDRRSIYTACSVIIFSGTSEPAAHSKEEVVDANRIANGLEALANNLRLTSRLPIIPALPAGEVVASATVYVPSEARPPVIDHEADAHPGHGFGVDKPKTRYRSGRRLHSNS